MFLKIFGLSLFVPFSLSLFSVGCPDTLRLALRSQVLHPAPVVSVSADQLDLYNAYEGLFESGHLSAGLAKIKLRSDLGNPIPRSFDEEVRAGGLGALFKDFVHDADLVDLMPAVGIDRFIQDHVYRLGRTSDTRRMSLSSWLVEWEQEGFLDAPSQTIEEFFSSWWGDLRSLSRMGTPQGRPFLTDLCASVLKIQHGNDFLSVSLYPISLRLYLYIFFTVGIGRSLSCFLLLILSVFIAIIDLLVHDIVLRGGIWPIWLSIARTCTRLYYYARAIP
jgi:hypothetical protein